MDFGQQRLQQQEAARQMMYQNSGYQFERRDKKTLILDHVIGQTVTTFSLDLSDTLIVDKLSDIYLDSFITFQASPNDDNSDGTVETDHLGYNAAFVIKINEFNIQSVSNQISETTVSNNSLTGSLMIPNEETSVAGAAGKGITIHKNKKLNYVCSINPCKLTNISGSITNLKGTPIFNEGTSRFILEFVIIARD